MYGSGPGKVPFCVITTLSISEFTTRVVTINDFKILNSSSVISISIDNLVTTVTTQSSLSPVVQVYTNFGSGV